MQMRESRYRSIDRWNRRIATIYEYMNNVFIHSEKENIKYVCWQRNTILTPNARSIIQGEGFLHDLGPQGSSSGSLLPSCWCDVLICIIHLLARFPRHLLHLCLPPTWEVSPFFSDLVRRRQVQLPVRSGLFLSYIFGNDRSADFLYYMCRHYNIVLKWISMLPNSIRFFGGKKWKEPIFVYLVPQSVVFTFVCFSVYLSIFTSHLFIS